MIGCLHAGGQPVCAGSGLNEPYSSPAVIERQARFGIASLDPQGKGFLQKKEAYTHVATFLLETAVSY